METDIFENVWRSYAEPIKVKIASRALEIAKEDGRTEIIAADAYEAMKEFMPGRPVITSVNSPIREGWINKNVTGFIGITAVLAITFGVLGIGALYARPDVKELANGFVEICKIFAGALVGGAAGAAAASSTKR